MDPAPRVTSGVRGRSTVILFVLASALSAFVYLYEMRGDESPNDTEVGDRLFPGVDPGSVGEIRLESPGRKAIRAVRRGDDWEIVSPVVTPGRVASFEAMAEGLARLSSARRIDDPAPHAVYGLVDTPAGVPHGDTPAVARVVFRTDAGEHALWLGDRGPIGPHRYVAVRMPGEAIDAIHLVREASLAAFRGSLAEVRSHVVAHFDPANARRVALVFPAGGGEGGGRAAERLDWRRAAGDAGWVSDSGPVASDAVTALVEGLAHLEARAVAADGMGPNELRALRIDPARVAVRVLGEGDGELAAIDVGAEVRDALLVRAGLGEAIYEVPLESLDALPLSRAAARRFAGDADGVGEP